MPLFQEINKISSSAGLTLHGVEAATAAAAAGYMHLKKRLLQHYVAGPRIREEDKEGGGGEQPDSKLGLLDFGFIKCQNHCLIGSEKKVRRNYL